MVSSVSAESERVCRALLLPSSPCLAASLDDLLGTLYVGSFSCESGSSSPSEFIAMRAVSLGRGVSGFFSSGSSVFFCLFFWAIKKQSAERGGVGERDAKGGGGEALAVGARCGRVTKRRRHGSFGAGGAKNGRKEGASSA